MFVFDNVLDKDVISYEYQLYKSDQVTGSFPNYSLISNPTIYLSGQSGSNVFSVAVENSTDVSNIRYYGRVRTKDTSNNYSSWSPIIRTDQDSPLIGDEYLSSITAAKITAGTIGAHQIILSQAGPQTNIAAPANMAILRSSDYNGSYNSNTSTWTNGTSGWIVAGDGHAEFSSASIRGGLKAESVYINADNRWRRNNTDTAVSDEFKVGSSTKYLYFDGTNLSFTGAISSGTIDIGGSDATSFHVDSAGNMWLGASTYAAAPFKVSSAGAFSATSGSISGSLISGGTISGTSININSGTFQVTSAGALTATSASIAGTINATSGSIGNLIISGGAIEYNDAVTSSYLRLGPQTWPTNNGSAALIISSNYAGGSFVRIRPGIIDGASSITSDFFVGAFARIDEYRNSDGGNANFFGTLYGDVSGSSVTTSTVTANSGGTSISAPNGSLSVGANIQVGGLGIRYTGPGVAGTNFVAFQWGNPNIYAIIDNAAVLNLGPGISDIRFKTNISSISNECAEKILNKVKVIEYNPVDPLNNNSINLNKKYSGVIAQELIKIFPDLVESHNLSDPNNYLSISYTGFIPYLIKTVQYLNQRIAELEKR